MFFKSKYLYVEKSDFLVITGKSSSYNLRSLGKFIKKILTLLDGLIIKSRKY